MLPPVTPTRIPGLNQETIDIGRAVDQVGRGLLDVAHDLDQTMRVGTALAADDDHQVADVGRLYGRFLPVLRGQADVVVDFDLRVLGRPRRR